jgi:hypothetical protein
MSSDRQRPQSTAETSSATVTGVLPVPARPSLAGTTQLAGERFHFPSAPKAYECIGDLGRSDRVGVSAHGLLLSPRGVAGLRHTPLTEGDVGSVTPRNPWVGWDHRCWSLVDSSDDLGAVDPA